MDFSRKRFLCGLGGTKVRINTDWGSFLLIERAERKNLKNSVFSVKVIQEWSSQFINTH